MLGLSGASCSDADTYLRQSQVTSRCDSVILKMLWMALAARICLMVSEMMSADSAVLTSMEPRKRTMKSWCRMESGPRRNYTETLWGGGSPPSNPPPQRDQPAPTDPQVRIFQGVS